MHEVPGQQMPYSYSESLDDVLDSLAGRVAAMRRSGKLTPEVLTSIRKYFRFKDIYNSNAIEGNQLSLGETKMVVREGLTIAGHSLKDHVEAKNLAQALDYFDELATSTDPLTAMELRQIHKLVLQDINDANAGAYRRVDVEITGSGYSPPGPETVPVEMQDLGDWLSSRTDPGHEYASRNGIVYAAAAHAKFVTTHPFVDGNGRVGRLLMNLLLMRYGFPIAVITKEDRARYYDALEESQATDLSPFISLVAESVQESLEQWESAAESQIESEEWGRSLADKLISKSLNIKQNEYEVWHSAMDLGRNYFRQTAVLLDSAAGPLGHVYFRDFGDLDFDKYIRLSQGESAKRTWFFRLDFATEQRNARYLFFFARPSSEMRSLGVTVSLLISKEMPPGSFFYELLEHVQEPNEPALRELGFIPDKQGFVARYASTTTRVGKIETIGKRFIEQVIKNF